MMRGSEDQRARDRDALAHAARELVRILRRVAIDVEPDLADPLARALASLVRADTPRHSSPNATLSSTVRLSNDE